jgi:Reverse transcriptase (RNA-dependent DNA polymerase)
VYSKVRQLQKRKCKSGTEIKDKDGNLLKDEDQIRNRWKEYIEELYVEENVPSGIEMSDNTQQASNNADEQGPSILKEEIRRAIKEMKLRKAEGIDGIPAEFLKALGDKAKEELIEICQQIYETGKWPEDFLRTVMVPLKKKPNANECSDHRTISLVVHASKILLNILTKRIESKIAATNYIGEDQFGFRKGRGTREAISVLRCLGERSLEHGKDLYVCFVDYEKAFDRVNWIKLMEVLQQVGVDKRDRDLIKNLYAEQTVVIRIEGKDSEAAKSGRGVRQGYPMSPQEFNVYIEALVKKAAEQQKDGVKVGGRIVQAVRFADDQV